jgi:hypothetical protein
LKPCLRILRTTRAINTDRDTQKVRIRLLVAVSPYGIIPRRLLIRTKLKIAHTLIYRAPFSATSLPRLATKSGATTSSTISRSACSDRRKSSSSSDSPPPIRKNPRIRVILISSIANVKSI